ncbi:transcription elongation factor GreA [Baekduia soli]|uniref:Transcription elongation factor GreA n=1 Tax=Baekduia soli TaxID=496014 RepID=A0A5B8U5P8_9ACTN|nr:transcription elongation factor GreA [Baekduia soli]QEC48168.1 transcription elongation factor GreA [Baekduia soli]
MAEAITREGLAHLKSELEELEGEGRRAIAQRILVARELGDLSENAEYHAAKEDQAHHETKIARLTERLRNAKVVEAEADATVVTFGATVKVTDVTSGRTTTYTIVGATEADLKTGKLSAESPVAKALIGAAPGETVTVSTPSGKRDLRVEALGS